MAAERSRLPPAVTAGSSCITSSTTSSSSSGHAGPAVAAMSATLALPAQLVMAALHEPFGYLIHHQWCRISTAPGDPLVRCSITSSAITAMWLQHVGPCGCTGGYPQQGHLVAVQPAWTPCRKSNFQRLVHQLRVLHGFLAYAQRCWKACQQINCTNRSLQS